MTQLQKQSRAEKAVNGLIGREDCTVDTRASSFASPGSLSAFLGTFPHTYYGLLVKPWQGNVGSTAH